MSSKVHPFFATGKVNVNVAPFPSSLFRVSVLPPWASIMLLDIYKPSPVPFSDFDANFSNSLGIISRSMPLPVSLTVTATSLPPF